MLNFLSKTITKHRSILTELTCAEDSIVEFKIKHDVSDEDLAEIFRTSLYYAEGDGVFTVMEARSLLGSIQANISGYLGQQSKLPAKIKKWFSNLWNKR